MSSRRRPAAALLPDRAGPCLPEGFARQALALALRGLDLAEVRRRPADMTHALAQVARSLKALDAFAAAESYLEQALHWARLQPGQDHRVDLVCELAEVACAAAEAERAGADGDSHAGHVARERARDHAFAASALAGQTADAHWEVKVLLRVSDVLDRCGDHEDAASLQTRAISLMGLGPDGEPLPEAAVAGDSPALPEYTTLAPGSTLLM